MHWTFCCAADNDLYVVLNGMDYCCGREATLDAALDAAPRGSAVLALADTYPRAELRVTDAQLDLAASRGLRLFLEFPAAVPGLELGAPCPTQWERAVVASPFFAPDLDLHTLLALHDCWYLPTGSTRPHLVAARVAGYRRAVYGLPESSAPLLFELPDRPILIATTKLSQFVTARYGPTTAWQAIWRRLLRYLCPEEEVPALTWEPAVALAYSRDETPPPHAPRIAFARSVEWFDREVVYSIDWKKGAIEGFEAGIDHRGRQLRRTWPRGDCLAETAMVFAWDWTLNRNPASRQRAGQLLDYVLSAPDFLHEDPGDPAYGLGNWFERGAVFYGDDNARVLLAALTTARLVDDERWDERILRCLLANLRTTGRLGFRHARINQEDLEEQGGWSRFRAEDHVHYAPHYQAYLWAVLLWGYALTDDPELLERPRQAIRMTLDAYPAAWRWTNGLAQELARMLLPLSFLVRVQDTAEHRSWLLRMTTELLRLMEPCGAIRELLGPSEHGSYGPPATNEAYGTREATLIQTNGDPACDLLYTTNYAFLGLHEAVAATGDPALQEASERLATFLCRIQVRSTAQPYLHGAWMRAFDYELWEYWGSSADLGWGAWSVESGWTNTWIASVLAMRACKESLFDLSLRPRLQRRYGDLRTEMLAPAGTQRKAPRALRRQSPGSE